MHAQTIVGRAGEYIGATVAKQVVVRVTRKQCADKNRVVPDFEIPAGTPIAGRHVTAVVTQQLDRVFQVRCAGTHCWAA